MPIESSRIERNLRYLCLLARQYPTVDAAATEIINLQAILNLPKGTEHFLTDIHGENEPFEHVLKNASGVIKGEIERIWGRSLSLADKKTLATLIYYPEQKLDRILRQEPNPGDWYKITLYRLVEICRSFSAKYTRSKVRKAMPRDFTYILDELLNTDSRKPDKTAYYNEIIDTIIRIGRARAFILALSRLIQRLAIDRLHIIGDIHDRGPGADKILDTLLQYHAVDIQWGNHDILWMGAASGSEACLANCVRLCARYGTLDLIENSYGINLLPLATFSMEAYRDDPCTAFLPHGDTDGSERRLAAQMHKAIFIIQLKLEAQLIKRHPEYQMDDRLLLSRIDYGAGTIEIDGAAYRLADARFPTIDPFCPDELTREEADVVAKLRASFLNSERLQKHKRFLFTKGSLYLICNSNLLFHGCIPLDENGEFLPMRIGNGDFTGKPLLDALERQIRKCVYNSNRADQMRETDLMWFLWCGKNSPLFGKDKMAIFESYLIPDPVCRREQKNPYYLFREEEDVCKRILSEFGLDPEHSHIINGHVPVEKKNGENPIKANGRLISIDGGFAKAYHNITGIAGYTLIFDSAGLTLVSHEPFKSTEEAIAEETDIRCSQEVLEQPAARILVKDTDIGSELQTQIDDLMQLLGAYQKGLLKEQLNQE